MNEWTWNRIELSDEGDERITKTSSEDDFRPFQFSATAGIGYRYYLGNQISFSVGPRVRLGMTKIIDTPISAKMWSVGGEAAFIYSL